MSTYTYKLKGARWLRTWTAADRSSVYAAQSEAQKIADTLCDVPWTRAKSDGPAMFPLTAAKSLDENPANRDLFDAALFCADHSDGAHRAYANAAMYLFELPTTTGVHLNSVKVHVESDAYNALGARIAVHLLSSAELPTDCATVRTGAAHAEGVAARRTVARDGRNYWYSNSADVTITGGTSESPAAIGDLKQYLAVFVGLENYATSRNEWLEGASYIRNLIEIETDAVVTGWTDGGTYDCVGADPAVLLAGGSSPTWLQPPVTENAGTTAPSVPDSDSVVETFFTALTPEPVAMVPVRNTLKITNESGSTTVALAMEGDTLVDVVRQHDSFSFPMTSSPAVTISDSLTFASTGSITTGGAPSISGAVSLVPSTSEKGLATVSFSGYLAGQAYAGSQYQWGFAFSPMTIRTHEVTGGGAVCIMLRCVNGVPTDADLCDSADESSRRHKTLSITAGGTAGAWTVEIDGTEYTVVLDSATSRIELKLSTDTLGSWHTGYAASASVQFFDPAAKFQATPPVLGIAATLGDFSAAVATFEAGEQPPNAELLGRLVRMAHKDTGPMLSVHPAACALANELDVLRPVPRFFRDAGTPPTQESCQPGISAWYYRPSSGSEVAGALAYGNGAAVSVGKVTNPVFLQLALLALRAPSAFGNKLVLANYKPDTSEPPENIATDIANPFKLRFVAWVSPADQWDGSNAFAMAAMASMPSVYRSDGEASVSWQVDCSGSLMPLGVRTMTARRIGVSEVVAADIAAGGHIDIPLDARVGEGDVVLIAPEVLGFADGTGAASVHFGRQANPASAASKGAWARYTADLGWFPKVTGE